MIYTKLTKKAIKFCYEAHKDQVDRNGVPYAFHPYHLAEQMPDETTIVVALLHDIIEDTDYTLEDLKEMGFSEEIVEAVDLLTHREEIPYLEYVENLKDNEIARIVKIADLYHNSNLSRLDVFEESDAERMEKYRKALEILQGR